MKSNIKAKIVKACDHMGLDAEGDKIWGLMFDNAIQYLEHTYPENEAFVFAASRCKAFYNWWSQIWAMQDELLLHFVVVGDPVLGTYHRKDTYAAIDPLDFYKAWHRADRIEYRPNDMVLREIRKQMKKQKNDR